VSGKQTASASSGSGSRLTSESESERLLSPERSQDQDLLRNTLPGRGSAGVHLINNTASLFNRASSDSSRDATTSGEELQEGSEISSAVVPPSRARSGESVVG
jgi:hypothetical protein